MLQVEELFRPIDKVIPGRPQGSLHYVEEVGPRFVRLRDHGVVELPSELHGWADECVGLTGRARFCRLPSGRHAIDWVV